MKNFDEKEFEWKVILNEGFTKDTEIGSTYEDIFTINCSGKITFLYDFGGNNSNHCPP
jgi:hypothetical protein